nr:hypothetical protein [Bacillota bacterium]
MKTKHTFVVRCRDKSIGRVEGDTFKKRVHRARHFFRAVGGYAIQAEVLDDLLKRGIKCIEIRETDTGNTYRAPLHSFLTHGVRFDAGHGEQVCLPLRYFEREDDAQITLFDLLPEGVTA